MPDKDEKIRQEILKWLYARFEEDPNGHWTDEGFFEGLDAFDEEDVVYNVERMDGEFVEKKESSRRVDDLFGWCGQGAEKRDPLTTGVSPGVVVR